VPGFIVAQLAGCACAILAVRTLYPDVTPAEAAEIMLPHSDGRSGSDAALGTAKAPGG
jgi:hypothetical protein